MGEGEHCEEDWRRVVGDEGSTQTPQKFQL
jgi:hypothetical protein